LRGKIEQQQSIIWNLSKERDIHIHEKELLQHELKLSHETLNDADQNIKSLEKEIEQERHTIHNETIRHQNLIEFLNKNKSNIHMV